ncbi:MAG: hypothetical protein GXZ06_00930 [Tissierellia bacterium]|nr:hypothetical protein [Tissierellia bacterium]
MGYIRRFVEKLFIIIFCLYNSYKAYPQENLPLYLLIAIIISSLLELVDNKKIKALLYILFGALALSYKLFVLYIPLILYDLYVDFNIYAVFIFPLVLINFYPINLLLSIFSVYMAVITKKHQEILEENIRARDKIREDSLLLEKYNEQLKKDREKNIHIAILTERNRIAKKLHDAIGHTLSSSILQVESVKIISKEKQVVEKLDVLQDTLTKGMEEIRKSIHNLYNESLDLKEQIEKLCTNVPNIDVELIYRIEDNLSYDMKFDIISVVKEGITNCVKHSNADKLKISLLEQPKFYSIIIKDNGSKFDEEALQKPKGIGLLSMKEIADKYKGFLNYSFDDGFKVHLTLMKG